MMLERGRNRTLSLAERLLASVGGLGQRAGKRPGHEHEGLRAEREGSRLTGNAHHTPGGPRESNEVLALSARRTPTELGREASGVQELEAERERGRPRARRVAP